MEHRFIRLQEVLHTTGLKRAALYKKVKQGKFPKQYKLGERSAAWIFDDVQTWITNTIAANRQE